MKASPLICFLLSACFLIGSHKAMGIEEAKRIHDIMKLKKPLSMIDRSVMYKSLYIGRQEGLMDADRIQALPGQPEGVDFDQYAGYVTVDPKSGRQLFYYFVEAAKEPDKKPLVLWLNGGPGCSSLGGGGMLELGPFIVNGNGKTLSRNEYAWSTEANMLFLESPSGVGFSYSNNTKDYNNTGDQSTTYDSYTFLINWLQRFPQYKDRDFFIIGESYGGHYIPELANAIFTNNNRTNTTTINLKGIAIGNAYLDEDTNKRATYDYLFNHAYISPESHDGIQSKCSFVHGNYSTGCIDAMTAADNQVGQIDYYNIYAPLCQENSNSSSLDGSVAYSYWRVLPPTLSFSTYWSMPPKIFVGDPCRDQYVKSYLNLPEVQRALHANNTGLSYPWSDCSDLIGPSNWKDSPLTMLPVIKEIIAHDIRVWLYSGDIDSVVPVTSTQYSLDILGLPIETSWRAWYSNDEVAGYVVGYKGLIFVTVRGAGHMVPLNQPKRSLILFNSFLGGQLPPE